MSEFFLTVFKGLYPLYFFLLIFGVIHRIKNGKWNVFDSFLLVSFLIFEFLAAFQISFFYGILSTSKRYLWIGLPFTLPFAADGLQWLLNFSALKKFSVILCLVLTGVNIYNIYSPIIHQRCSEKKNTERTISREIALWISNDWKNSRSLPIAAFKCDHYQSGKRPLVQSELTRIGWFCGGQDYPVFFPSRNIVPDYIVSHDPVILPDYILVNEIKQFKIYKNKLEK